MSSKLNSGIKYLLVGGMAFISEYVFFIVLYYIVDLNIVTSNVLSFIIGFIVSFLGNRQWSFSKNIYKYKKYTQLVFYSLLAVFNILLSSYLIYILSNYISLPGYVAKFITVIIIVVWNYFIYKNLIFKNISQ